MKLGRVLLGDTEEGEGDCSGDPVILGGDPLPPDTGL